MKKYNAFIFFGVMVIAVMVLSGCSGSGSNYYRGTNDSNIHWVNSYVYYDDDHHHDNDHDNDNKPPSMGRPDRPSQLPTRPSVRPNTRPSNRPSIRPSGRRSGGRRR